MHKCPRSAPNNMNAEEIFELDCPECGESVELIKDEEKRKCSKSGAVVVNSRLK
jgi:hypothetical protein